MIRRSVCPALFAGVFASLLSGPPLAGATDNAATRPGALPTDMPRSTETIIRLRDATEVRGHFVRYGDEGRTLQMRCYQSGDGRYGLVTLDVPEIREILVLERRRNPGTTLKGTLVGLFLGAAGGFFLAEYPLADDLHVADDRLLLTGALGAIGTVLGFTLSVTCAPTHDYQRLIWSSTP